MIGHLKQALLRVEGAGKCALLMAEEFGFQQLTGQSCTIQVEERFVRPGSIAVDPVGQHTLPRAGFALQQNRALAARHPPGEFLDAANGSAGSEKRVDGFVLDCGDGGQRLRAGSPRPEHPLQHGVKQRQLHRLDQELFRAILNGADRGLG